MELQSVLAHRRLCRISRRALASGALAIFALATLAFPSRASILTNGSFENTNGASSSFQIDSTNLPGWSNGASVPQPLNCLVLASDIGDPCGVAAENAGIVFWTAPTTSPDGGNFIAVDSDPNFSVALTQTLNGLVSGDTYEVDFYQGAAQFKAASGDTTDYWAVTLGSETEDSALMTDPSKSLVGWESQSMDFTATATSELLTFFAVGTPMGGPPTALLDGITITDTTTPTGPVPEPSMWAGVAIVLAGLIVVRRRQQKRA